MKLRPALSIACAWLVLAGSAPAAAACPEAGGIGGTGVRAEGGIGGTGVQAEGGVGGTGATAENEIGLLGVITGFGSICVNGVEVHYDSATPVSVNGQPAGAEALALGQTVAVRAAGAGAEERARAISVLDAAVGPITAADRIAGTLHVLGQSVRLAPSTVFGPGLTRAAVRGASVGETLRVSGLRSADGTIVATRVERAAPGAAVVYGSLAIEAGGVPRMGGVRIDAQDAAQREMTSARGPVLVAGRVVDGRLVAERVLADPLASALAPGRFVAQAYVDEVDPARRLRAGGMQYSMETPGAAGGLARDQLVRLYGRVDRDGRRVVERFDFLAEPLNPRPQATPAAATPRADDRRGRGSESGDDRRGRSSTETGDDLRDRSGPPDRGTSERPDRGSPGGPPDRPERSGGGSSGRPDRVDRSGRH